MEIKLPDKLLKYLESIKNEGGFGETTPEVIEHLLWEQVRKLVASGWIDSIGNDHVV